MKYFLLISLFISGMQLAFPDSVIDDFEDGNNMNYTSGSTNSYDDRINGGTSVSMFRIDTTGANGSKRSAYINYTLGNAYPEFFAGMCTNLGEVTISGKSKFDYSNVTSISFWIKGNGKQLDVVFSSALDTLNNPMYFRIPATPANWIKYTIRLPLDLNYSKAGISIPWSILCREITAIQFKATSRVNGENGSFRIDDLTVQGSFIQIHRPAAAPYKSGQFFYENFDKEPVGIYTGTKLKTAWNNAIYNSGLDQGRCDIVTQNAYRGNSLRVKYPQGKIGASESGAQWCYFFSGSYDSLYLQYKVMFSEDFDFSKGGKLPGLAGGTAPTGGQADTNGFSARLMWRKGSGGADDMHPYITSYVYHLDQPGVYGEDLWWAVPATSGRYVPWNSTGKVYFKKARWYTVKIFVAMNTPGKPNGKIIAWLDNQKVLENKTMKFLAAGVDWFKIDLFYFSTFFGGSTTDWAPLKDVYAYFDEMKVSTTDPTPVLTVQAAAIDGQEETSTTGDLFHYPNPCSDNTRFHFILKSTGYVSLKIKDTMGKVVKILFDQSSSQRELELLWDLKDESGQKLSPGIYYYQFTQGRETIQRKLIIE